MKLLNPQVEITPGRRPQGPAPEGQPGIGSAVLRLINTSQRENAYTVRLLCEEPYWQEEWFSVMALPPTGDAKNAPPAGKPDQVGPQKRWVKVYVSRGGQRDILVSFFVPESPVSRSAKYPFKLQVETYVSDASAPPNRKERFTDIPGTAIIRPFYKWSMDLLPEEGKRVGRIRNKADFEVVLTNQGNEWLYLDLKAPRSKDMALELPSVRVAVPPPEPGEERMQRTVPLRGITRLKAIKGERNVQPLALTAQRVDAPTVPPNPNDPAYGGMGVTVSAVVANDTSEVQPTPADRTLTYCPPIPSTLTGCLGQLAQSGKSLVFTAIGFIALLGMLLSWWQFKLNADIQAQILTSPTGPKRIVTLGGKGIAFAQVQIGDKDAPRADIEGSSVEGKARSVQETTRTDRIRVMVPPDLTSGVQPVKVKRISWFPLLPWQKTRPETIDLGTKAAARTAVVNSGTYKPGDRILFKLDAGDAPLSASPSVNFGTNDAHAELKGEREFTAVVPGGLQPGHQVVTIKASDGGAIQVMGDISIGSVPPPPPPPPPASTAGALLTDGDEEGALAAAEKAMRKEDDGEARAVRAYVLLARAARKALRPHGDPEPEWSQGTNLLKELAELKHGSSAWRVATTARALSEAIDRFSHGNSTARWVDTFRQAGADRGAMPAAYWYYGIQRVRYNLLDAFDNFRAGLPHSGLTAKQQSVWIDRGRVDFGW